MSDAYSHARPINKEFYEGVRRSLHGLPPPVHQERLPGDTGTCVFLAAGQLLSLTLLEGPQIVNLFAFNPHDPDERLWVQETSVNEFAFLRRYSRLWGTMARYRPLLTMVEDTIVSRRSIGGVSGNHHFLFGGSGTPADWEFAGGPQGVKSTWERLTEALGTVGLPPEMLLDNACMFQKTSVDPTSQRLLLLPSDAIAGDRVVFFAEIDLTLVLALSPYRDGSLPPSELDGSVRAVEATVFPKPADPLRWPYEGIPYPDLSLYLNAEGVRSTEPGPTPGLQS